MRLRKLISSVLIGGTIAFGIMRPNTGLAEPYHHNPTGEHFNIEVMNQRHDSRFYRNHCHEDYHNEPYWQNNYGNFRRNRESDNEFYPNGVPQYYNSHHYRTNR